MNIMVILLLVSVWSIIGVFWLKETCIRNNNFEPNNKQILLSGPIVWCMFGFIRIYNNLFVGNYKD